jgi:molybdopterin-containing oxidoreductase family iron-sulfur binding subunit
MTEADSYGLQRLQDPHQRRHGLRRRLRPRQDRGKDWEIACTQHHQLIDFSHLKDGGGTSPYQGENLNTQRGIIKEINFDSYKEDAVEPAEHHKHVSLYPDYNYTDSNGLHKWGMVIDQTACIGCQACVTACQSENNIAVVGKRQVIMQREMHWLRIDTYYTGDPVTPDMLFQPMLCQHCEQAPCETSARWQATSHSDEGINEMTYNRCVGTRYCSNNCPYKVRRFNFLQYNENLRRLAEADAQPGRHGPQPRRDGEVHLLRAARQPHPHRAQEARRRGDCHLDGPKATRTAPIACEKAADVPGRPSDGSASRRARPEAIIFGDLHYHAEGQVGPQAPVHDLKQQPDGCTTRARAELNTPPRTTYLADHAQLNPALPKPGDGAMDARLPAELSGEDRGRTPRTDVWRREGAGEREQKSAETERDC